MTDEPKAQSKKNPFLPAVFHFEDKIYSPKQIHEQIVAQENLNFHLLLTLSFSLIGMWLETRQPLRTSRSFYLNVNPKTFELILELLILTKPQYSQSLDKTDQNSINHVFIFLTLLRLLQTHIQASIEWRVKKSDSGLEFVKGFFFEKKKKMVLNQLKFFFSFKTSLIA